MCEFWLINYLTLFIRIWWRNQFFSFYAKYQKCIQNNYYNIVLINLTTDIAITKGLEIVLAIWETR